MKIQKDFDRSSWDNASSPKKLKLLNNKLVLNTPLFSQATPLPSLQPDILAKN